MDLGSRVLVTDARRAIPGPAQMFAAMLVRVAAIIHAGSSRHFLACLAARARAWEGGGKAIVFNHPGREICLGNDLGVMDGARASPYVSPRLLRHRLSRSLVVGGDKLAVEHYSQIRRKRRAVLLHPKEKKKQLANMLSLRDLPINRHDSAPPEGGFTT